MIFSIVVCTCNGGTKLNAVFNHLQQQQFYEQVEWVVVDNNSTDNTVNIIHGWFDKHPQNVTPKYILENIQGLAYARIAGVRQATGKYIVFCDDDNWLYPNFLSECFNYFESHPYAGLIGGESIPVSDISFPDWFAQWQYVYACGKQNLISNNGQNSRVKLWGAGLCIRASIAAQILNPAFPLLLTGRKGLVLTSGEDDEICYRAWILGYYSYYVPSLKLEHFMPAVRLTVGYRDRLIAGFAHQVPVIGAYHRYIDLLNFKGIKLIFFLRKLGAWMYYKLKMSKRQALHAGDFLYFYTGIMLWENRINKQVKGFYEFWKNNNLIK